MLARTSNEMRKNNAHSVKENFTKFFLSFSEGQKEEKLERSKQVFGVKEGRNTLAKREKAPKSLPKIQGWTESFEHVFKLL